MTDNRTEISIGGTEIRGKPLSEVTGYEFTEAIWLVLQGELPTEQEKEVLNVVLSSIIEFGIGTPSSVTARTVESCGNSMNASVAGGVLALGDYHGGAGEACMYLLQSDKTPEEIVSDHLDREARIPGLGHQFFEDSDPRTEAMFSKAQELNLAGEYMQKIQSIQNILADQDIELVINADGGLAAVLSDLGWEPEYGKGIFIIGRVPGLVAHVREEMDQEPFRQIP